MDETTPPQPAPDPQQQARLEETVNDIHRDAAHFIDETADKISGQGASHAADYKGSLTTTARIETDQDGVLYGQAITVTDLSSNKHHRDNMAFGALSDIGLATAGVTHETSAVSGYEDEPPH